MTSSVATRVLDFFNGVTDPYEIVNRIQDDPDFGGPQGYPIGPVLAGEIINARDTLPGGVFESIQQIDDVPGVGPDTLHDILFSFREPISWTISEDGQKVITEKSVGIGMAEPGCSLHIQGSSQETSQLMLSRSDKSSFGLFNISDQGYAYLDLRDEPRKYTIIRGGSAGSTFGGGATFVGNVGIGITYPKSKLAVNGIITAKEIKITQSGDLPDHVFDNGYKLKSINELETYIQENKHLPNIPSAEDVAGRVVAVGEMQVKLLEKIEELTLYVIELKKKNDSIKERLTALERIRP